ncbi:MAG: flagellar motor protein MotB [Phycisphaerae bacterium]
MNRAWTLMLLPALLVTAVGCQNKLHKENLALHEQNRELQARTGQLEMQLANQADPAALDALRQQLADREAKIGQLQSELTSTPTGSGNPLDGLAGVETSYNAARGEVTVRVAGDVLFDSGKTTLKPSAQSTLTKIASAIKSSHPGKTIRVEGHTDTDPIRKTRSQFRDNRDLSLERAAEVTRFLEKQGIAPAKIATVGWGEHRTTGQGKNRDRRVEIVVLVD